LRVTMKNLLKKCLDIFVEIAEKKDDYNKFHKQFVKCLKLGFHKEYVDRMKEGQYNIHHITGESIAVVTSSSFLEYLRKRILESCTWSTFSTSVLCSRNPMVRS